MAPGAELRRADERLLRRIRTRRGRVSAGAVLLEGPRAIESAIRHGAKIVLVVTETGSPLPPGLEAILAAERLRPHRAEVPKGGLTEFAQTERPQGILAVAREPGAEWPPPATGRVAGGGVLILDRIQDPGNAGALVRAAAALEVERVIALDGTADLWGAKAVRAAAGLSFALPLHHAPWREVEVWLVSGSVELILADSGGRDVRDFESSPGTPPGACGRASARQGREERRWALLIGNEASGPRPEALAAAATRLAIPLPPGVDSLNAALAGALLLWELGPARKALLEAGGREASGTRVHPASGSARHPRGTDVDHADGRTNR